MAYAYGSVSDYNDFLTKMMEFASGTDASTWGWTTGGAVPSGEQWTILSNTIPASGIPAADFSVVASGSPYAAYLQGPGSESGDNITVGIQTYQNRSNFVFGFAMQGYTEYDSTLTWATMPGVSPPVYTALAGVAFNAWFWVSGRRIMATARIGGLYDITFYLGFFLPYGTHSQYPYPLFISGSVENQSYNYTQADYGQSCIPDPGCFYGAYFRFVDGSWQPISQWNTNNPAGRSQNTTYGLYPLMDTVPTAGFEYNNQAAYAEFNLIEEWGVSGMQFSPLEVNAYPLFPIVLNSATQLPGQLENIFYVPGNGLNPGDTITIDGTVYDVFHNCWRSTQNAFYCIPRI